MDVVFVHRLCGRCVFAIGYGDIRGGSTGRLGGLAWRELLRLTLRAQPRSDSVRGRLLTPALSSRWEFSKANQARVEGEYPRTPLATHRYR